MLQKAQVAWSGGRGLADVKWQMTETSVNVATPAT